MAFDLIKYNNTKRSAAIDPTKVVVVYDTTVSNELDLVNAYVTARGLNSDHIYPLALGTTYNTSTLAELQTAFLDTLGAYVIANDIEAICCSPNCPVLIGDESFNNQGVSMSGLLALAKKAGLGEALDSIKAESIFTLNSPYISDNNNKPANLNTKEGLINQEVTNETDVTVGGIELDAFSVTGQDQKGQVALDLGRTQDLFGNASTVLPSFRIGYAVDYTTGGTPITASQITDMVNNAIAMENTTAYQKDNLGCTVLTNDRTDLFSNGCGALVHHYLQTAGYTDNLKWGYRSDQTGDLSDIATNTGISKYNPVTANADLTIQKPMVNQADTSTSINHGTESYVTTQTVSFNTHNGTTFPISTGLIYDLATMNPSSNATAINTFDSGNAKQVFDLAQGAMLVLPTSYGLRNAHAAIEAGASVVVGSAYEPLDSGLGTCVDTIQYLLKGYEVCAAKAFDTGLSLCPAEVWGDGLARLVNDTPVYSTEETDKLVSYAFEAEVAQNYGNIVIGGLETVCGAGVLRYEHYSNASDQASASAPVLSIVGLLDSTASGMGALFPSPPSAGFTIITSGSVDYVGQAFPFDSIRITDRLDAGRLDRIVSKADLGNGIATLDAGYGAGFTLSGDIGFEDGREYAVELRGLPTEFASIEEKYRVTPQPSPSYGMVSRVSIDSKGVLNNTEYVQDNTVNFVNSAVEKQDGYSILSSSKATRNNKVVSNSLFMTADNLNGDVETAEANLAAAQAALDEALANAGSGSNGTGVTEEYKNSTNLPSGRDFGTKRYQNDGDIIPNYIHTDFPDA